MNYQCYSYSEHYYSDSELSRDCYSIVFFKNNENSGLDLSDSTRCKLCGHPLDSLSNNKLVIPMIN